MTSACLVDTPPLFAPSIRDAVRLARRHADRAPFIWVTQRDSVRAHGLHTHRETADGGHVFLQWRWDGHCLIVENDAFGLIPAYVYRDDDTVAVSTSIERLINAGATVTLDRCALAVFLRLGFFVGDDTPFHEIRALPPGTQTRWETGRVTVVGGPYVVREMKVSRDDAIDGALDLTNRAIASRASGKAFAVPLSGGRDSRHILLGLRSIGCRAQFAVTVPRFPPRADEDRRVASLLADAAGVDHVVVQQTSAPGIAEARKNVATHYCADEHAWFFPMLDYVAARADVLYEGIGGSLWTTGWLPDGHSMELWRAGRTREVARRMLEHHRSVDERVVINLLGHDASDYMAAVERLSGEIARHREAPDPGKSFHFWNRLRRELALVPFGMMRQEAEVYTPFVDRDLVDFLLSLDPATISPSRVRSDKSFHSEVIRRSFPQLARIPFEDEHATRTDATQHNRALTRSVAAHLLHRGRRLRTMRNSSVWPRVAHILLNARYAATTRWFANATLYLSQLDDLTS